MAWASPRLNPCASQANALAAATGKRGRLEQSKALNLLTRLRKYRDDVWRFAYKKDVPFTNNLAEQALRIAKVKQKISGGVTIPRQSRGLSIGEPLKAAKQGRLRGPNSWCHLVGGASHLHSPSCSNLSSSFSWCRM